MLKAKSFWFLRAIPAFALLGMSTGLSIGDEGSRPRIIRPPDDRTDFYATSAMLQGVGNSVCAQLTVDSLIDNGDGTFTLNAGTLGTDFDPLCAGQRFGDQPTAAGCTATLVGPDVLITAGHCLDDNGVRTDLSTIRFVFDYAVSQQGVNPATFTTDQVFTATAILGLANVAGTPEDWAVVRLDRAVTGRALATVRTTGALTEGQSIVAIGFGAGLPMKFSGNSTVQAIVTNGFEADLDVVGGNSGGPIVDATTGMIEGVLSADQAVDDYFLDGACNRATVCPDDPQCDGGFTSLASVMITEFQTTLQAALGGAGGGDGTPGDADGDGVADADDFCDGTPAGTQVDIDGCAVADGGAGGDGGGAAATPLCGAMGLISTMFLMLGLALMPRRK